MHAEAMKLKRGGGRGGGGGGGGVKKNFETLLWYIIPDTSPLPQAHTRISLCFKLIGVYPFTSSSYEYIPLPQAHMSISLYLKLIGVYPFTSSL